jgi:glycosyltransferase involved in cell wall biosynthesis
MPPIEAMACGAPVITSNTSSLPEVVGDAALQVDPHNVDELAHAITRLLQNQQLREDLRQNGYQRAQLYTWERSARQTLRIYQQLSTGQQNFADKAE